MCIRDSIKTRYTIFTEFVVIHIVNEKGKTNCTVHIRSLSKYKPRENTKLPEKISEDEKEEEEKCQVKRKRGRPRKTPYKTT